MLVTFLLLFMLRYKNNLEKLFRAVVLFVGGVLFFSGMALLHTSLIDQYIISSFYNGFALGIFSTILQQLFPRLCMKVLFVVITCIFRYFIISSNNFIEIFFNVLFDAVNIVFLYQQEKGQRNAFRISYASQMKDTTTLKDYLTSNLAENIIILTQNLETKIFANDSFISTFNVQTLAQFKEILSSFKISRGHWTTEFYQKSPLGSFSSESNFLDFLNAYKNIHNEDNNIITTLKVESPGLTHDKLAFEVKLFCLKWNMTDSIALVFRDLSQQSDIATLKAENERKDQILTSISHELRTPINAILGIIPIIEEEFNDPKFLSYWKTVTVCSKMLLNLVNSILDLEQISKKTLKLNVKPFLIQDVVDEIKSVFQWQFFNKQVEFNVNINEDVPSEIVSDRVRLTQIIVNLLANALKFTFQGTVTLEISQGERKNEIDFTVRDTGLGIKEENKPKLFKAFGKLIHSDPNINIQGVGLGLVISNNLVKLLNPTKQNAKLEFDSEFGKGTTFSFSLAVDINASFEADDIIKIRIPSFGRVKDVSGCYTDSVAEFHFEDAQNSVFTSGTSPVVCQGHAGPSRFSRLHELELQAKKQLYGFASPSNRSLIGIERIESNHIERHYVLLVDDFPFNLMIVSRLLHKHNFEVITAFNGQEAIEKVKIQNEQTNFFKFILMDWQMPIMDGIETTKVLKAMMERGEIPMTPIYGLSASEDEQDREECLRAGMMGYFSKPLKENDLEEIMERHGCK